MTRYLVKNEEHSSKTLTKKSLTARGVIMRSYNVVLQCEVVFAVNVWFDRLLYFNLWISYQLTMECLQSS